MGRGNERNRDGCICRNINILFYTGPRFTLCLEKTCSYMGIKGMKREDFGDNESLDLLNESDTNILLTTIVHKMAPVLKRLYDEMSEPKYVVAMGACAISGGPFFLNSYSVVKGVEHVIPVDVYVPGCPPRPEALLYGMLQLQRLIETQTIKSRKERNLSHDYK